MLRILMIASLVGLAAPLCADELMDQLLEGKKPEKVAREWFKGVPKWLNDLNENGRSATSWFRNDDGELRQYRIEKADELALFAREMQLTGEKDAAGNPARTPVGDTHKFTWKQWAPEHMAATYPVESNPSVEDVVAFAVWLYTERKAAIVANSVLTVVYLDDAHEGLREPIAAFIRNQEDLKKDAELAPFDLWDKELRAFRKILVPADKASEFKEGREKAAGERFMDLHDEFKQRKPRTMTLEQLAFELRQWATDFGDTAKVKDHADLQKKLLAEIEAARLEVETYTKVGETYLEDKKPDPAKALAEFKKARELEPFDLRLLSKTANAGFQLAHPTLQSTKSRVVGNENAAAEAIELYELWLLREPANVKVMLCIGQLHHLKGETDKARKQYEQVINLELDAGSTKHARTLKKAADDNPKNEG